VCHFSYGSVLLWGAWAVVQASLSTIDFDYLSFANRRFQAIEYFNKTFDFSIE
jgi:hypothetical protein